MSIYIYIYVYIYTHTHTHLYTHSHTLTHTQAASRIKIVLETFYRSLSDRFYDMHTCGYRSSTYWHYEHDLFQVNMTISTFCFWKTRTFLCK